MWGIVDRKAGGLADARHMHGYILYPVKQPNFTTTFIRDHSLVYYFNPLH